MASCEIGDRTKIKLTCHVYETNRLIKTLLDTLHCILVRYDCFFRIYFKVT